MRGAVVGMALFCATAHAGLLVTQGDLRAGAEVSKPSIKYAEQVQLTLWVEGPAPLDVTPPKPVLANSNTWRVYETGLPLREVLPNQRQRWQQSYRLAPLLTKSVPIVPTALRVRPGGQNETTIEWTDAGTLTVTVIATVEQPSVDALRPPTDIEQLPPPIEPPATTHGWLFTLVPVSLIVAGVLIWRARRAPAPGIIYDAAWATAELPDTVSADQCAAVLRAYVGHCVGLDARALTTAELLTRLPADGPLTTEHRHELHALLEQCDQLRFSGQLSNVQLGAQARAWVQRTAVQPANSHSA